MSEGNGQTGVSGPMVTLESHLHALREADKEHVKELRAADQRALEIKAEGDKEARRIKEQGDEKALNLAREIDSYKDAQQKSDLAAVLSEIKTAIKPLADYVAAQQGRSAVADPMMEKLAGKIELLMAGRDAGTGAKEAKTEQRDNSRYMIAIIGLLLAVLTFVLGRGGLH